MPDIEVRIAGLLDDPNQDDVEPRATTWSAVLEVEVFNEMPDFHARQDEWEHWMDVNVFPIMRTQTWLSDRGLFGYQAEIESVSDEDDEHAVGLTFTREITLLPVRVLLCAS